MRGGSGGQGKNAASESYRAGRDRVALMWEARDAVRNNPLVALLLGSQMAPGPGADARARRHANRGSTRRGVHRSLHRRKT